MTTKTICLLSLMTFVCNIHAFFRNSDPFRFMHDAFTQLNQDVKLMHEQMKEHLSEILDQVSDTANTHAPWHKGYHVEDKPEAIILTMRDMNSDMIPDANWDEEDGMLTIVTDHGTIKFSLHDDHLLAITVTQEEKKEAANKETSHGILFRHENTTCIQYSGMLKSLGCADIKYDKNGTKELVICLPKELKSSKKVAVVIS